MRTTIDISDGLLEELRKLSRAGNRSFRATLEEILQRGLASSPHPSRKVRIKTFPVGIKPAYRAMSMNQLYDQLEAEDSARVAEP